MPTPSTQADSQIADATKLRTEAEAMKAEYEQNLQNARTEANEIVANAQKTATARGEEIVGEARAQAAALKQKAEADIAQERKKAVNEVKDEIGGIAMEIALSVTPDGVPAPPKGELYRHEPVDA